MDSAVLGLASHLMVDVKGMVLSFEPRFCTMDSAVLGLASALMVDVEGMVLSLWTAILQLPLLLGFTPVLRSKRCHACAQ
jgi:hypothetical protein